MVKGKLLNVLEYSNKSAGLIKLNSDDVQVFGCGSIGERICLCNKNNIQYSRDKHLHLASYDISKGYAMYHLFLPNSLLPETLEDFNKKFNLIKW